MTDTFTLSDGINTAAVTFQYINSNNSEEPTGDNVGIDIAGLSPNDVGGLRTRTRDAINDVEATLLITATNSGNSSVNLRHDRFTSRGNIAIAETVSDNSFDVTGMSGGAGGDCAALQPCRSGADCVSGTCTANVCQ